MTEIYYAEQRHLLPPMRIRREQLLPGEMTGDLEVGVNSRIAIKDIIARGEEYAPYALIDAARYFGLRRPEALDKLLQIGVGDLVERGQVLAGRSLRRGRRLFAPITGRVTYIGGGRIILRELAESVALEAGLGGTVVDVRPGRGVIVESYGAVLQGVWGNGRRSLGVIKIEPPEGLESIFSDQINVQYRSAIVVTRRPLKPISFQVIEDQGFAGIIAPSMAPDVLETALAQTRAVLLTEGFGEQRINPTTLQFFEQLEGRQATVEAVASAPLETRRPEVIITVPPSAGERPLTVQRDLRLTVGLRVRIVRGDSSTAIGEVTGLPKMPVSLENGLRVMCAQVELATGEVLDVPLANIELLGR